MTVVEEAAKMEAAKQGLTGMMKPEHWSTRAQAVVDSFHQQRVLAAQLSKAQSDMERDRTAWREKTIADLISKGTNKTAAKDQVRLAPEYVEMSKKIVESQEAWEICMADSEHARMTFEIICMKAKDAYDAHQRLAELKGMEDTLRNRMKELGG
ncbi:MAG: hypothetical protein GY906_07830 [bacterium]|nr:hypothetical protein [bacterium]